MKGLLLKDWYMMKKYCRAYLVITIAFIALSFVSDGNMFFVFYPCLLCGMIPVNLFGYDERSRWIQYSGTLPYTKTQIVSAKYLIGLFVQVTVLIVMGVAQGIKMSLNGNFALSDFIMFMLLMPIIALLPSSICLPFVFKLGVEKGRTAYYVMIGLVCAASAVASGLVSGELQVGIQVNAFLAALAVGGVGLYILSWYLSVVFFGKRELQ